MLLSDTQLLQNATFLSESNLNNSSPTESEIVGQLMQDFLGKIASRQYKDALELVRKLLKYEPDNKTYLEYEIVLQERINQLEDGCKDDGDEEDDDIDDSDENEHEQQSDDMNHLESRDNSISSSSSDLTDDD
jgi:hypothetical protein